MEGFLGSFTKLNLDKMKTILFLALVCTIMCNGCDEHLPAANQYDSPVELLSSDLTNEFMAPFADWEKTVRSQAPNFKEYTHKRVISLDSNGIFSGVKYSACVVLLDTLTEIIFTISKPTSEFTVIDQESAYFILNKNNGEGSLVWNYVLLNKMTNTSGFITGRGISKAEDFRKLIRMIK